LKFVAAGRLNQHASRVRSPDYTAVSCGNSIALIVILSKAKDLWKA